MQETLITEPNKMEEFINGLNLQPFQEVEIAINFYGSDAAPRRATARLVYCPHRMPYSDRPYVVISRPGVCEFYQQQEDESSSPDLNEEEAQALGFIDKAEDLKL